MAKYKLFFNTDEVSRVVSHAEVDEENMVVKEEVENSKPNQGFRYNYYPLANLTAIIYLGED